MKIGYFGGTFDPIHLGHLALAQAVLAACKLDRVLFVPTDSPPHKRSAQIAPFIHRYTMVALALAELGEERFVSSLLEAPAGKNRFRYSLDTIRRLRRALRPEDELFFLVGADAFSEIATWHKPVELLRSCEFIVVSRPGYPLSKVTKALPAALRLRDTSAQLVRRGNSQRLLLPRGVTIHLVDAVHHPASATAIRSSLRAHTRAWRRMVPNSVADYIQSLHLYEEQ